MPHLTYTIIKSDTQYKRYCSILETLVESNKKTKAIQDEIELLYLLIEKYDAEHKSFGDADPIELLKYLMSDHQLKAVDLASLLNISEGLVSDMQKYKKGLSKETIRILSQNFKISQDALNKPYALKLTPPIKIRTIKKRPAARKIARAL